VRSQLVSVLTCLHCEKRIIPGTPAEQQAAVKELTLNLSKLIAPVVTLDQGLDGDYGSPEEGMCIQTSTFKLPLDSLLSQPAPTSTSGPVERLSTSAGHPPPSPSRSSKHS
jgi:hypothetical protein